MAPVLPAHAPGLTSRAQKLVLGKAATWSGGCLKWMKRSTMWKNFEKNFQLELIHEGDNAAVHKAMHLEGQGGPVAVKMFWKDVLKVKEGKSSKVKLEWDIHSNLQHPNIVLAYLGFEDKKRVGLVMEYAPSKDLYDYMDERDHDPLKEPEARKVVYDVLAALQYMHQQGIVHRDVKLENIFQSKEGHWKLGDFGSAVRIADMDAVNVEGTLGYMAPEYLPFMKTGPAKATMSPVEVTTPKLDSWGVGAVAYYLLVGQCPFEDKGATEEQLAEAVLQRPFKVPPGKMSRKASSFVRAALQKNPEKRASVEELLAHEWLQPPPVNDPVPVVGPVTKPRRRKASADAVPPQDSAPVPA